MKGHGLKLSRDMSGEWTVSFSLFPSDGAAFSKHYDDLKDADIDAEITKYHQRRSLNANALCWKLCTEIANVLRTDKESVYLEMLKRYGQSDIFSIISEADVTGYFKYYDVLGTGTVKGKEFTHYRVYKGSSEFSTKEMSILLDGILDEAKGLNIPVLSAEEISLIKSAWEE